MRKDNVQTIVELTDTHAKLFQAKETRKGRAVTACDIKSVEGLTDDEIYKVLTDLVLSKKVDPEQLQLVLPRRLVILKIMKLPSQNTQELRKMTGLQLVNQIPYSMDDVIYDHCVLEKNPDGYTRVLAIVVHRDVVGRYLKIFQKMGVPLGRFTFSSLGILGWFRHQRNRKGIETEDPVAVINIDLAHGEICFCHKDRLLFSRMINYGAKDIGQEEIRMLEQLRLSLVAYQKEKMGGDIKQIILTSTLKEAAFFRERVEQEFKIPTAHFTSLENVLSNKKINLDTLKEQAGISLTAGIGFLLSDTTRMINLAPEEVFEIKKTKRRKREMVKFVVMFILAAGLGLSILGYDIVKKMDYLARLDQRLEATERELAAARKKTDFVDALRREFAGQYNATGLMAELFELTPPDISFRTIEMDDRGRFSVQGYAQNNTSINVFQDNLVNSRVFNEVNLQFATKRRIFNIDLTDFKIVSQLNPK